MKRLILLSLFLIPSLSLATPLEVMLVEKGVISAADATKLSQSNGDAKVYYNKGTVIEFPDFSLRINGQMQAKYLFSDFDTKDNTSSFSVRRARLVFEGDMLDKEFSYKLQTDFVGTKDSDGRRSPNLRDAWIAWHPTSGSKIQFGQMKPLISRQEESSSVKLQFIDRTAVSEYFSYDREPGIQWSWRCPEDILAAFIGLHNGDSTGEGINSTGLDTNHFIVGSLRFSPFGKFDHQEEGDVNNSEKLGLSFGVTGGFNDANKATDAGVVDADQEIINVDANLKYQGFSIHSEFFNRRLPDEDTTTNGAYLQSGYFLLPKKLEVAGRVGTIDCDDGNGTGDCKGLDSIDEAAATLNYYFSKHNLKLQAGANVTEKDPLEGSKVTDVSYGMQVSSYF